MLRTDWSFLVKRAAPFVDEERRMVERCLEEHRAESGESGGPLWPPAALFPLTLDRSPYFGFEPLLSGDCAEDYRDEGSLRADFAVWCRGLSALRRLLPDGEWLAFANGPIEWDQAQQAYDPESVTPFSRPPVRAGQRAEAQDPRPAVPAGPPFLVVCQDWMESERGWGQRPDGFSLHLDNTDRDGFVEGYETDINNLPEVPDAFSTPDGPPRIVEVDERTYEQIVARKSAASSPEPPRYEWQRLGIWGEGRRGPDAYVAAPRTGE